MQLCGVSLSPFYERVLMVIETKGALDKIEQSGIPGGFKSAQHMEHNPLGLIPYLIKDDGSVLPEGQVIAEYLDRVLEGPSVMPVDADGAANVQLVCRLVDLYVVRATTPMLRALVFNNRNEEEITKAVSTDWPAALDMLEHFKPDTKFAAANVLTIADYSLIPLMFQMQTFFVHFGIAGFGNRPKLNAWWNTVKDLDVVKNSHSRMAISFQMIRDAQEKAAAKSREK